MILTVIFFTVAPLTLGVSLFSLFSLSKIPPEQTSNASLVTSPQSGVRVYASLPIQLPEINVSVGSADARPEIIRQYLDFYHSPLSPLADYIVADADKFKIDYRLITAIAQQESNLCKIIPPGSYNCWGWGITGSSTYGFKSYQQGIDEVSEGLRENYLDKGYTTVEQIMSKYTPLSNGSWANGVNTFMSDMQ